MARILVVDYSRSGNTRRVAQAIARSCEADLDEIRDTRSRGGIGGYVRSCWEAWRQRPAAVQPPLRDPAGYDLVVLGSPVWVSHVSSPMRRYLLDHATVLKRTALFVTEGGSGGPKALAEMAALLGQTPVATLVLKDSELRRDLAPKLGGFLKMVRESRVGAQA